MRPGFSPVPSILQIRKLRLGQSRDQQARATLSPLAPSTHWQPQPLGSTHTFQARDTKKEGRVPSSPRARIEFSEVAQGGSCSAGLFRARRP